MNNPGPAPVGTAAQLMTNGFAMQKTRLMWIVTLLILTPMAVFAAMDHASHRGNAAHEEVVAGVKATFSLTRIADDLRARGLPVPKGMKETHHLAAAFVDVAGRKPLPKGLVAIRVQGPGQDGKPLELTGMDGHFGIDLDLSRPGSYMILCRFVLDDGKKRQAMFHYEIK